MPRTPGQNDDVLAALAVNAEPWGPPPGMVKKWCPACGYWFAVPVALAEREKTPRCLDCRL